MAIVRGIVMQHDSCDIVRSLAELRNLPSDMQEETIDAVVLRGRFCLVDAMEVGFFIEDEKVKNDFNAEDILVERVLAVIDLLEEQFEASTT